jgi:hypothetical protein
VLKSPASKGPNGRNERGGRSREQTEPEGAAQEETIEGHENNIASEAEESEETHEEGAVSVHSGDLGDAHGEGSREEGEDSEGDEDEDEDDEEDESDESEGPEGESRRHRDRKQRPVYVSKTVPPHGNQSGAHPQKGGRNGAPFNLQETLRQVESYVNGLRGELQTAQRQLRQREDDRRARRPERPPAVSNPGELSVEELIRLNQQLEFRNAELQARIDDLTIDSEVRAASRGLITDAQPPDPNTELRTLLGFKLKEDREDFLALEQEARDLVVQQYYRTVLRHVFEVLDAEGIQFPASE